MSTKQQLKLAWIQLTELAKKLDTLTPDALNLEIVEIEQQLIEARRLITTGGFTPVYAIGIEHREGEYGMTHGPVPNLEAMLAVIPFGANLDKYCLFRFHGEEPVLTHRWHAVHCRWEAVS